MTTAFAKIACRVCVFAALGVVLPSMAQAECVALWKTARDAQRGATLVFSGTVVKSSPDVLQTSFEVDRVWKGDVRKQTTLTLYPGLESHGASYFQEGIAYLVFAEQMRMWVRPDVNVTSPETPVFEIGGCSPTRPLADAQDFVKQLGAGKSPRP